MRLGILLAGAVLTGGAVMSAASVQAAPQGAIVVADNDQHHDDHPQGPPPKGTPPKGAPPKGGTPPGGQQHGAPQGQMGGPSHNSNMMGGQNNMSGHMNGQMGGQMGGAMTGHGTPPKNFDRHTFQRNITATRHFHVGGYSRPSGWYAHRWVYGEILPALFWSQNYWLSDYFDYGLADPPPGFVWVRDGDDALLVDQNSGEILQVEYGVFD